MRVVTQFRVLFWLMIIGCALGGGYEIAKAAGLFRPKPQWQERCAVYRTDKVPVKRAVGGEIIYVETYRPVCLRVERRCVVPKNAHPQTCEGAA